MKNPRVSALPPLRLRSAHRPPSRKTCFFFISLPCRLPKMEEVFSSSSIYFFLRWHSKPERESPLAWSLQFVCPCAVNKKFTAQLLLHYLLPPPLVLYSRACRLFSRDGYRIPPSHPDKPRLCLTILPAPCGSELLDVVHAPRIFFSFFLNAFFLFPQSQKEEKATVPDGFFARVHPMPMRISFFLNHQLFFRAWHGSFSFFPILFLSLTLAVLFLRWNIKLHRPPRIMNNVFCGPLPRRKSRTLKSSPDRYVGFPLFPVFFPPLPPRSEMHVAASDSSSKHLVFFFFWLALRRSYCNF